LRSPLEPAPIGNLVGPVAPISHASRPLHSRRPIFHDLTQLSAYIPTVALVFGNSNRRRGYVPGMCDYAVMVDKRAKVSLAARRWSRWRPGKSRVRGAGRSRDALEISGLSDYFATEEPTASESAGQIVADRIGASSGWPIHYP